MNLKKWKRIGHLFPLESKDKGYKTTDSGMNQGHPTRI